MACSSQQAVQRVALDEDQVFASRDALQMYLVLTNQPAAMQSPADVEDMWTAVRGEQQDFTFVSKYVSQIHVPADYRVDVELDFASLPHPKLSAKRLHPMLRNLPAAAKKRSDEAVLAVSIRSRSQTLPLGNHIRLVGAAVLRAAERYNGVIVDLLARRAYTADSWRREISRENLSARQIRIAKRRAPNGRILFLSRGHIKYGAPDVVVGPFRPDQEDTAKRLFLAAQVGVLRGGGHPGQQLRLIGRNMVFHSCSTGGFDGKCVRLPIPEIPQ